MSKGRDREAEHNEDLESERQLFGNVTIPSTSQELIHLDEETYFQVIEVIHDILVLHTDEWNEARWYVLKTLIRAQYHKKWLLVTSEEIAQHSKNRASTIASQISKLRDTGILSANYDLVILLQKAEQIRREVCNG